jgi:hypothetical protein
MFDTRHVPEYFTKKPARFRAGFFLVMQWSNG